MGELTDGWQDEAEGEAPLEDLGRYSNRGATDLFRPGSEVRRAADANGLRVEDALLGQWARLPPLKS